MQHSVHSKSISDMPHTISSQVQDCECRASQLRGCEGCSDASHVGELIVGDVQMLQHGISFNFTDGLDDVVVRNLIVRHIEGYQMEVVCQAVDQ